MMYICAWHCARRCSPEALISSRIAAAARIGRPAPPYSSGISAARKPASVSSVDELGRIGVRVLQLAPVGAGIFLRRSAAPTRAARGSPRPARPRFARPPSRPPASIRAGTLPNRPIGVKFPTAEAVLCPARHAHPVRHVQPARRRRALHRPAGPSDPRPSRPPASPSSAAGGRGRVRADAEPASGPSSSTSARSAPIGCRCGGGRAAPLGSRVDIRGSGLSFLVRPGGGRCCGAGRATRSRNSRRSCSSIRRRCRWPGSRPRTAPGPPPCYPRRAR